MNKQRSILGQFIGAIAAESVPVGPAPVGPVVSEPTVYVPPPTHQAQDDPQFLEMLELIRGAGL